MADDLKMKIDLEAEANEQQVKKEADRIAEITQKQLDKEDLIIEAKFNQVRLEQLLSRARQELQQFKRAGDEDMELEARINVQNIQDKIAKTKSGIRELEKEVQELEKQKTDGVSNEIEDIGKSAKKSTSLVGDLISKFGGFLALGTLFKKYIDMFNEFQKSQKAIVQATGASGQKLKELTDDMVAVSGNVNQSQGEIAEAVGELNTRLGVSGEELQGLTEDYLKFAYVTGQDGKEAISENVRMFNQWGVSTEKQVEYLDKLAKAGQDTGINVGNLTKNLQENSAVLREMGFSLDDSIALLSNFEKNGIEASNTLQAMKIGISNLVSSGRTPNEALEEIVESIKNAKSNAEGMNIAFETFGNRGLAMYNAIKQGNFSLEEMKKSLAEATGTVDETQKSMETFGEFISRKWEGFMTSFADWNNEGFQATRQLAEGLEKYLAPAFDIVSEKVNAFKAELESLIQFYGQIIRGEREWTGELTKKGQYMEQVREQTRRINEVEKQYEDTAQGVNKALKDFGAIQIDDSATQQEFEASKQKALEAAKAFAIALDAKMRYAGVVSQEAYTMWKNGDISTAKAKDIIQNNKSLINQLAKEKEELVKTVEEINKIEFTPGTNKSKNKNNNNGGGSGKGSKAVKSKKEELEEMRNLELQAVYDSEDSQEEKYKKYLEIYDKYKDKIIEAEGKTYDSLEKEAEDYFKKQEDKIKKEIDYYEDLEKVRDKVDNTIEKHTKNVEKLGDEWTNVKKKATDSIREVNNQLKELDEDYSSDIGERFVEVQDSIKEFQRKYGNAEWLKGYSVDMLKDWGSDEISGIKVDDAIEYLQLLEEEKWLNDNITDQIKKQAEEISNLTEAQKIENEYQDKKNSLLERRNILEAVSNSGNRDEEAKVRYKDLNKETVEYFDEEEQQWKDITDFKNEEYARDVLDNQEKLQQKKEDLDNALNEELKAYGDQVLKIKDEYSKDTKNYTDELDKKKKAFANYVKDMNELASQLSSSVPHNAYGGSVLNGRASWVGENGPEQIIARQSSYVQPRNAINNNSTVYNNQSSLNINGIEIGNFNTIDDLLNELKNRLTYRN